MRQLFISIHALREEGDACSAGSRPCGRISIHALREEGDHRRQTRYLRPENFYPRPPRGGRQDGLQMDRQCRGISIHALREEGDASRFDTGHPRKKFLSTPSARRATRLSQERLQLPLNFYPRPPRGGRQVPPEEGLQLESDFYPRPPRGGRRSATRASRGWSDISIHALREEGDCTISN